jgi:ADP-ribose pyrophosphatase YjhB (NUDIX family)
VTAPRPPKPNVSPLTGARRRERDWAVRIDGRALDDVGEVTLESPRFGTLTYGQTAAGHDGWTFREVGGGGGVVVPWLLRAGRLHVGVVLQYRPNQGGRVWNVPRGFVDPGESHLLAARREFEEETSVPVGARALTLLEGEPANPNSAFFETPDRDLGVRFYALALREDDVAERDGEIVFALALETHGGSAEAQRTVERIRGARFLEWTAVARLGDMFSVAAVARLLAHQASPPTPAVPTR